MSKPLVSIIIPTKNSAATLEACLKSCREQKYDKIELIVVDNFSSDDTKAIAENYADMVYSQGPERSAQRNYGVDQAKGEYVAIIDSDMELTPKVVEACVEAIESKDDVAGVIIPEESFGVGFWAQCKRLERSFYVGNDAIEAARFFSRDTYIELGGYDEKLVSGEDWDLSNRIRASGGIVRVDQYINHNEGRLSLLKTLKKKYYYARLSKAYFDKNTNVNTVTDATGPIQRFKLFFNKPKFLFANPRVGVGMIFMKFLEYSAGALGLVAGLLSLKVLKNGR